MSKSMWRRIAGYVGICAGVAVAFWGGFLLAQGAAESAPPDRAPVQQFPLGTTAEFAMVYIGSSTCVFCQDAQLPGYLAAIRDQLGEQARAQGRASASVGISVDPSAADGVEHLGAMADFDEVVAGRNWANIGAMRYLWDDLPGQPATPQVILVSRDVVNGEDTIYLRNEAVMHRAVGIDEVERLATSFPALAQPASGDSTAVPAGAPSAPSSDA